MDRSLPGRTEMCFETTYTGRIFTLTEQPIKIREEGVEERRAHGGTAVKLEAGLLQKGRLGLA